MTEIFHICDPNSFEEELQDFEFGLCNASEPIQIDLESQPGVIQSGEGKDWDKILFAPGNGKGRSLDAVGLEYSTVLPLHPKGLQNGYAYVVRLAKTVHGSVWTQDAVLARATQIHIQNAEHRVTWFPNEQPPHSLVLMLVPPSKFSLINVQPPLLLVLPVSSIIVVVDVYRAGCVHWGLVSDLGLYTDQSRPDRGRACMDCVLERADTAVTVGLEQGETPDIANSVLSTDSSAADVDNQGTLEAKNLSLLNLTVCDCRAIKEDETDERLAVKYLTNQAFLHHVTGEDVYRNTEPIL